MKSISPKELESVLASEGDAAVIDVRGVSEYDESHVRQAENLPLDGLSPRALIDSGRLPADRPVYILCRSGKRAETAASKFLADGFGNAVVVEGGTLAWIAAGLPVETGGSGTDAGLVATATQAS